GKAPGWAHPGRAASSCGGAEPAARSAGAFRLTGAPEGRTIIDTRREPMKRSVRSWMAVVIGLALVTVVAAQDNKPSGSVTMESKSIAVGIGVSWGDGTLTFQGKPHKFAVSGLSVADLGISKVTAKGSVYNLKKLEDFDGNYVAAEAAGTIGGGA